MRYRRLSLFNALPVNDDQRDATENGNGREQEALCDGYPLTCHQKAFEQASLFPYFPTATATALPKSITAMA